MSTLRLSPLVFDNNAKTLLLALLTDLLGHMGKRWSEEELM